MDDAISRLLRENQQERLRQRRSVQRKPFVRPVSIRSGPQLDIQKQAFSKDLSNMGIGLICDREWDVGTVATLEIHSISGRPVRVRSDVRWSDPFGRGWYLIGWRFLEI